MTAEWDSLICKPKKAMPKRRIEFKFGFLVDCYRAGKYLLYIDNSNDIATSSAIIGTKKDVFFWEYETNNSIYYSLTKADESEVELEKTLREKVAILRIKEAMRRVRK